MISFNTPDCLIVTTGTVCGNQGTSDITGPELLTGQDFAQVFSNVTGHAVQYISPDEAITYDSLVSSGWPVWQSKGMLELFEVFASNQAAVISPDGEKLLGRPLARLQDFVAANKSAFI